jgi:hypothetical protein
MFDSSVPFRHVVVEAKVVRANGAVEDLGTIASWHRNPLRRAVDRLRGFGRITAGR